MQKWLTRATAEKQPGYGRKAKDVAVEFVGWAGVVAAIASVYFLWAAIFDGASWWQVPVSAFTVWILYRVMLYHQLEKDRDWLASEQRVAREAMPVQDFPSLNVGDADGVEAEG